MDNIEINDLNSLPNDDDHRIINNSLLSSIYSYLVYFIFGFFILMTSLEIYLCIIYFYMESY